jgi:orotate phosphoribosyltransferase-like protein
MKTKYTITYKQIKELADKGLYQAEIARQLNCSRENIRQWCNRYDIKTVKHFSRRSNKVS